MLIHVDLGRLDKHLHILEQQLILERRIAESLDQRRADAMIDPDADFAMIDRQIRFMVRQQENTRSKQTMLENMIDLLHRSNYQMENKAISATDALSQLG